MTKRALEHLSKSYRTGWMAIHGEGNTGRLLTLAASAASIEEQANSALRDGKFPDGSTPVVVEKQIWRAQVKSQYLEPEMELDPSERLDFLYEKAGKTVLKHQDELPPRDDVIAYCCERHAETLNVLIQWRDCLTEHRPVIKTIICIYWDVFDPSGALHPILGYEFNIDVGLHEPVCCKPPRYGPLETKVMEKLLQDLQDQGVIARTQ